MSTVDSKQPMFVPFPPVVEAPTTDDQADLAAFHRMLAEQSKAAPIVATVPSDLAEIIKIEARDLHHKLVEDFNMDDDAGSNWLARGYITDAIESCVKAAAPSPTEQASDVRNAASFDDGLECAAVIVERANGAYISAHSKKVISYAIRSSKSATPADKGNAPAEAKS